MRHRATIIAVLALLALLMGHGQLLAQWIAADARPEQMICCSLVGDVSKHARHATLVAQGRHVEPWAPHNGWLPVLGVFGVDALSGADGLLLISAVGVLVGMVGMFGAGRALGSPLAGLVAAAVFPCVPAIAMAARRWDVYGMQAGLLSLSVWALLASRSLTKLVPTAVFAVLVALGLFLSPRETDGFLVLATTGAMTLGAAGRGLTVGRGANGRRIPRWRVVVLGALLSYAVAWMLQNWIVFSGPEGIHYYFREAQNNTATQPISTMSHRMAVVGHLFWRDLTPWVAIPIEVAAIFWLLRGKGRAEILPWIVLPLVALSLLSKKNFYYVSTVLPALPLVLGLGIAAMPFRWLRLSFSVLAIGLATVQLVARSVPDGVIGQRLQTVSWQQGDHLWGNVFQTTDHNMRLAPDEDDQGALRIVNAVREVMPTAPCCRMFLSTEGQGPWEGVKAHLISTHGCMEMQQNVPIEEAAVFLVGLPPHAPEQQPNIAATPTATVTHRTGRFFIYVKGESWMNRRCGM